MAKIDSASKRRIEIYRFLAKKKIDKEIRQQLMLKTEMKIESNCQNQGGLTQLRIIQRQQKQDSKEGGAWAWASVNDRFYLFPSTTNPRLSCAIIKGKALVFDNNSKRIIQIHENLAKQ
jgi:hypothetical protein